MPETFVIKRGEATFSTFSPILTEISNLPNPVRRLRKGDGDEEREEGDVGRKD